MRTLFIGQKLLHYTETGSTNDELKNLVSQKVIPEGTVVSTSYQTSGRGQLGNKWEARRGQNLLLSVYLRPVFLAGCQNFALNMSVCLALNDLLNQYQPGFVIKWPNDLLYRQQKVAGILIENQIAGSRIEGSIVGVGLNVNQQKTDIPEATSLQQILGRKLPLQELRNRLFEQLEKRYLQLRKDPSSLKKAYFENLYGYHRPVPVKIGRNYHRLDIKDVQEDGHLKALVDGKKSQTFAFKELSFVLA